MSTQGVQGSLRGSGAQGGRKYSGTATDGQWTSINTATGNSELGFAQKGKVLDHVTINYAAGSCAWAIKNRVTQTIDRAGFGTLSAATSAVGESIKPIMIVQDHIFQSYSLAAGTKYLAWVTFKGRPPELFAGTIANGSEGELTTVTDSSSLGSFADQVIQEIMVQGPDGKIVQYATVYDANGGEMFNQYGGERNSLGAPNSNTELHVCNLALPVARGMTIKLTVQA
jgi:hypothetical protein